MAAFMISRALINTGLATARSRCSSCELFGKSSLGVSLRAVAVGHGAGRNDSVERRALRRRDHADRAVHRRTVRVETGRDRGAAGIVSDDGGVSEHLRHVGDVLYGPGEQPAGGAHGRRASDIK